MHLKMYILYFFQNFSCFNQEGYLEYKICYVLQEPEDWYSVYLFPLSETGQ